MFPPAAGRVLTELGTPQQHPRRRTRTAQPIAEERRRWVRFSPWRAEKMDGTVTVPAP